MQSATSSKKVQRCHQCRPGTVQETRLRERCGDLLFTSACLSMKGAGRKEVQEYDGYSSLLEVGHGNCAALTSAPSYSGGN